MAEELNKNVARLSVQYDNLASWKDDTKNENGGYPLFNAVTANGESSSGGSKKKKEEPKGTEILVNGKIQIAGKSETVKDADGRTRTTVTVDSDKLKSLLSAEKEGAKVTIPIKDGVNAGEGKLTGEMVKSMESKRALQLALKQALRLDAETTPSHRRALLQGQMLR